MRAGFVLPNTGEMATTDSIAQIARQAEALGYDSVWVTEQEPFPVRSWPDFEGYDGSLPDGSQAIECPLEVLAVAAANTHDIAIGISLPNIPFYSPTLVANSLAALDVMSNGRLQLGLGLGWSTDEAETVRAALARPGTPASEFLRVLKTIWSGGPCEFRGEHYFIPRGACARPPMQRPHPPIHLTACAPAAIQSSATLLHGGSPALPAASGHLTPEMLQHMTQAPARALGMSGIAVRVLAQRSDEPLGTDRALFSGSLDQIRSDIAAAYELGAESILFDLSLDNEASRLDGLLQGMRQLSELVRGPMQVAARGTRRAMVAA